MTHVAEEHGKGGEQQAQAGAEQQHVYEKKGEEEDVRGGGDLEEDHDRSNGDEREAEVDERKEHLLQGKDHLLDADFLDEGRRVDDRGHGGRGGLAHDAEQRVAEDEVEGVVLNVGEAKEEAEHRCQNAHHEERIEHRPHHAKHAAAILQLEVTGNKRRKRKPIALKSLLRCCV